MVNDRGKKVRVRFAVYMTDAVYGFSQFFIPGLEIVRFLFTVFEIHGIYLLA